MSTVRPEPVRTRRPGPPCLSGGRAADPGRRWPATVPPLELTPDALMAAAAERTGLSGWGDTGLPRPPGVAVRRRCATEAGPVADTGVGVVFEQLVGNLVNRLRLEALIAAHPEIDIHPDRTADHHLRAAAQRHHPPAQPDRRRPGDAPPAVLGEPRAVRPRPTKRASRPAGTAARRAWTWSTPRCRISSGCTR